MNICVSLHGPYNADDTLIIAHCCRGRSSNHKQTRIWLVELTTQQHSMQMSQFGKLKHGKT